LKKLLKDDAFLFLVAGVVILFDQATKHLIRTNLPLGQVYRPELWLSRYVRLVHLQNTGAATGILQGWNGLFMALAFAASLAILYYYPRLAGQGRLVQLAMGLLMGGTVGNLIDRVLQEHVTDFLSIGRLPAGNIADFSLVTGVVLLAFGVLRKQ